MAGFHYQMPLALPVYHRLTRFCEHSVEGLYKLHQLACDDDTLLHVIDGVVHDVEEVGEGLSVEHSDQADILIFAELDFVQGPVVNAYLLGGQTHGKGLVGALAVDLSLHQLVHLLGVLVDGFFVGIVAAIGSVLALNL